MTESNDHSGNATTKWGEIDGVEIHFPVVVESMRQATFTYTVPVEAARELVPGDGFTVLEVSPGSAMFVLALVDYIENPWGDYNEVNFGLLAHPKGDPDKVGAFVYRMPVNQAFTCEAGNRVLGLPKSVESLRFEYTDDDVFVDLTMDGQPTLTVRFPRVAAQDPPSVAETITFSYLDGRPTEVPLSIELGSGIIDPHEISIELGSSPVADELRSLGLPSVPDMAVWGEGLKGTFLPPRPI